MRGQAKELTELILWCRKNGIAWRALTVGTITIDGGDSRVDVEQPHADRPTPREGIRQRYGAAMLAEANESEGMSSVVLMDD